MTVGAGSKATRPSVHQPSAAPSWAAQPAPAQLSRTKTATAQTDALKTDTAQADPSSTGTSSTGTSSTGTSSTGTGQTSAAVSKALQDLLKFEAALREAETPLAISHLVANEGRVLMRAGQVLVCDGVGRIEGRARGRFRIKTASSLGTVDRNAPLAQVIERVLLERHKAHGLDDRQTFELEPHHAGAFQAHAAAYPLRNLLWIPLKARNGRVFAGLLCARDSPWSDREHTIGERIATATAHAWQALVPRAVGCNWAGRRGLIAGTAAIALAGALFVPVPMSALAPFEIVPHEPFLLTAPIDGVIKDVPVQPNERVKAGDLLVRFSDTALRNDYAVADREWKVALARLKRTNQLAFSSLDGRRELAIATAERDVRAAARAYARERLEQTRLLAPTAGIAVLNAPKDLIGRPVKTGERLMQIAEPGAVVAQIMMPVADVDLLKPGAPVRLYLDSAPLSPRRAVLSHADYQAKAHNAQQAAFRAIATLDDPPGQKSSQAAPRLGVRGTAQVFGETTPLGIYLFRRPISAVRQWIGL